MDIALNVNESEFWSILIENPLYIKGLFFDNPFSLTKKVSKCGNKGADVSNGGSMWLMKLNMGSKEFMEVKAGAKVSITFKTTFTYVVELSKMEGQKFKKIQRNRKNSMQKNTLTHIHFQN